MKLTKEEVEQIAFLARLELSEEEKDSLSGHLNRLLESLELLQQLDTDGIEPTSHAIPVRNVFRKDVVTPSLSREDVLSNAPERTDGTFVVPRIVET